ncbi:MAG: hypothetical protein Q9218_003865 [Villophora microphyllina]
MGDSGLEYLYHHIFLPTEVPQRSDTQDDRLLLDILIQSIDSFRSANDHLHYQTWTTIQRSIRTFALLHSKRRSLSRDSLKTALQDASHGEIIILHIALQNSGLLIQRKKTGYVVETFEASPRSADVLAAQGALEWDFPSQAVVIPFETFENDSFQDSLAGFLEKASLEQVKQYAATTLKAGSNAYESRDTTFPAIIGQLLITILQAPGHKHTPTLTRKMVHDEVCWGEGAENPWRRSPTWLVLRVSIQRILCSLLDHYGTIHYKFFMCSLMSTLCQRFCIQDMFPADRLAFARTKLARRVAKLEAQRVISNPDVSAVIQSMFDLHEGNFTGILRTTQKVLDDRGAQLRKRHTKKMYRLPRRASHEETVLSLHHSQYTLNCIITDVLYGRPPAQVILPQSQSGFAQYTTWVNKQPADQLSTTDVYCLAAMEKQIADDVKDALQVREGIELDQAVQKLRRHLRIYQPRAYRAYKENAEQRSLMVLILMEVWVALDSLVLRRHPLLADYKPGFPTSLMHALKVAKLSDMHRLSKIEEHLERRQEHATYHLSNVLGDATKTCFAVRYLDQSEEMQTLFSEIWQANESSKEGKKLDLDIQSRHHENLLRQASETACLFVEDEYDPLKRQHDDRRCRKHYLEREASRMRIECYEDLLPADGLQAKAVVFELLLPSGFAAWRDSTWQLLMLARGDIISDQKPKLTLREYPGLQQFARSTESSMTLASRTKSFYHTHYAKIPFPAQLDQVCLPHGLKYGMYDGERTLWTSRHLDKPSFATICCAELPPKSAWDSVKRYLHPTFHDVDPSANEVVASQTRCPNNLTIAEYCSFQDLRIGTRIQWIKTLRELASSNINFGSVEITTLVTELALGAGPSEDAHVLRSAHWVFRNQSFCRALAVCVRRRLQAIATNWREGQTVECLLVLVQRLWTLGQTVEAVSEGRELLLLIRDTTHKWMKLLRREISNAVDLAAAQKRSRESLHAALLCRKTFVLEAARRDLSFEHATFACFLECAFTIRDNLFLSKSSDIFKLPAALRRLYVGDLKLVHSLESQIRWSLGNIQSAVSEAIDSVWTDAEGSSGREFSTWTLLPAPHEYWATARSLSGDDISEQVVHFNIIDGTLYIDGQLLGRLPDEFSQQDFFQQLFGDRFFLTRPSYLMGMSYMFVTLFEEHEIHFGFRDGSKFMRVRPRSTKTILEFLPSSLFSPSPGTQAPDLPLPLIDKYIHWLDIQARTVEVRPCATMWRQKYSDWKIDLGTCQGLRRGKSLLVDPRSAVFRNIAQLIEPFENRHGMVVYQPLDPMSPLMVDLPRLELRFSVGRDGLLASRQLRAYIDMDQDAGTLYGLRSSLVLRDSVLQDSRSILVAMGPTTIERHEAHVNISISHNGFYARFTINKILGRLECAPEPRLVYFKALCHAITSSIHPDPLTSKTGTAEAVNCLKAAGAQPWAPLDPDSCRILFQIADLTPPRVYYPDNLKALQRVLFDDKVMPASQSDHFRPLVGRILSQSASLHRFHLNSGAAPVYQRQGDPHLHRRALLRAQDFEPAPIQCPKDPITVYRYEPRDSTRMTACKDTFEAALLAWQWSLDIHVNPDLSARLQEWPLIQGYMNTFEPHLLSDLIDLEPASCWGSLFRSCQMANSEDDKVKLMFLFGTIAFGGHFDMTLIRSLIAIAVMGDSNDLKLPQCTEFIQFRRNQVPGVELLTQYLRPHRTPYGADERALLAVTMHSKQRRKLEQAQKKHEEGLPDLPLLDVQEALISVKPEWERLSDNYQLSEHVADVQRLLSLCRSTVRLEKKLGDEGHCQDWYPSWNATYRRPCMVDLMYRPLKVTSGQRFHHARSTIKGRDIISQGQDLKTSLSALERVFDNKPDGSTDALRVDTGALNEAISSSRTDLQASLESIRESQVKGYSWLEAGRLLPALTSLTLLEILREGARAKSHGTIQADLLSYAESLVNLQQLIRIQDAHSLGDSIQLANEWRNVAHAGWAAKDHIDWLLLEIDFDLIIREDQVQVARAMIASPGTMSNFVLQMNMGQGKSSVIIPMVAAALAKDENLVRVVVPRSLLLQAAQLLSSRLGGLISRRLKHIPFSRKSPTDQESIKAYHELHRDIKQSQGVLLALPEHLLSFQLSGLQALSNGRIPESTYMIKLQAWFAQKARDILDECDHMLAVKTQLIYPSGSQSPVDGHPNRWKSVQSLLKLAKIHIASLQREYPKRLEVIDRIMGAFPTVYFLDQAIKDVFMQRLTESVLRGDGGLLPVQEWTSNEKALAADFLHRTQFAKSTASEVAQVFRKKKDTRLQLLLLRGLLIHKILLMGLGKRWNVQYGIHPLRDPVAVPFRSKGIPSDQAEFGHPDVSILLTCLSFYNTGLTLAQFRQSLGLLLKSDEPVREFQSWKLEVQGFSESLSAWDSINVDDETQCTALWGYLRYQMAVVNFFLNHFVFPRHAKTFDRKLVSSGWDLATPLRAAEISVEKRLKEKRQPASASKGPIRGVPTALTVGFSGTNDNKTLLPLNVLQNNLPGLSHTNAEVLTYLLQPRNRRYVQACDSQGRRLSETALLRQLKHQGIRMLLDAGAQILELENIDLAKTWLSIDSQAEAAVFFGQDERARVVYRDGKVQPLAASPYQDNLGACVVYLDEAHTRGVDLKMPLHAVAALTLGVMQTKDHTVQAAMRLRQLAISQSVIFYAPPEVHQGIINTRRDSRKGLPVDSHDVIVWLLEQTCCSIEQLQPLYVSQGQEYCRRRLAAHRYEDSGYSTNESKSYLKILEQPERYSLEELYAPDRKIKNSPIDSSGNAEIAKYVKRLDVLKANIRNTGDTVQALAHQEVEQEREVAIEVETVRDVKKPHHAQACAHPPVHRDVRLFAETGRLAAGSHTCIQAFVALRQTAVGRRFGIADSATRSGLYITQDFSRTATTDHSQLPRDEYSRPVHWVLWSGVIKTALIISDYETNALIPLIRDASPPVVHLISYAAPITKSMVIFDSLNFFTIPSLQHDWQAPSWLVRDLGIFAGRTYFDYDNQYSAVCEVLGLPQPLSRAADLDKEMPFPVDDGGPTEPFSPSPLLFMQDWLAVRRKGQDFSQTMMGELCQGRRLDKLEDKKASRGSVAAEEVLMNQDMEDVE